MKLLRNWGKVLLGVTILAVGTLGTPAHAKDSWANDKRYALIVGIDQYENEGIVDLQCATSDATLLRDTLIAKANFSSDNIFLLTSDAKGESSKPTLTNLVFRLEWLRDIVNPGDTLVFYFAGHGVSIDGQTFLLTQDADQRSKNTLMVSSLPGSILNGLLKATGAQSTLVLLDACRNDPTAGSRGGSDNVLTEAMSRGLVFTPTPSPSRDLTRTSATIFACGEGQRSWEWADKNHGFFTYYLAQGLDASDGAYSGGVLTLHGLVGYLAKNVAAAALRETNQTQKPMVAYEGPDADAWVLARSKNETPITDENIAIVSGARLDRAHLVAEVQVDELTARLAEQQSILTSAQRAVTAAQNTLVQAEAEQAQQRSDQEKSDAARARVQKAKAELQLARTRNDAAKERLSATQQSLTEAKLRANTASAAKDLQVAYGSGRVSVPDVAKLDAQLKALQAELDTLQEQKRVAIERALKAERKVRELMRDPLDSQGLPTRSTRSYDLWHFDKDPTTREADHL